MASAKQSPVRKLLDDVGTAFGKFFMGDPAGVQNPPQEGGQADNQGGFSIAVMGVISVGSLLFFIWLAMYWYENRVEMLTELSRMSDDINTIVEPAMENVREYLVDCGQLEVEITADFKCTLDDNCMMTRDEMVASEERQAAYKKYCAQ